MTKKDYILIAEALRKARPESMPESHDDSDGGCPACMHTGERIRHARICTDIADALASENSRFDKDRFIAWINK